ncbi:monovalent cation/H(+) antiporter subunit G [Marisediminicola senii]|uniref:monovalent cation/H(+) antiporter subunit G n=1 Tax=Marisediminicola senii TaxID=2711233 RepID=UPI0013ECF3AD|nr:monovalent cation/H(+) antiporter subunit G [Marisediminicola senii]
MSLDDVLDIISALLVLVGAFLTLAAGVGLVRFPDALARLHAATKPQVLGLIAIVIAVAIEARSWQVLLTLIPVLLFQVLLAPIAAQMVGRAAYRTDNYRADLSLVDDLAADVERATSDAERANVDTDRTDRDDRA